MALQTVSLNSGSNGNCYYIGNEQEAILVDAGLSCRETERRLKRLGLSVEKIKAIFISHEHIDHVRGLAGLADKFKMPIYITPNTKARCYHVKAHDTSTFAANKPVWIGTMCVTAFLKPHDAADAHSFIIASGGITVGVFTDIGGICQSLVHHFAQCNVAFLEANYDENMLAAGSYPAH